VFVTVIGPLVALAGTTATSSPGSVRLATVAVAPLNVTVELDVNPTPVIVTCVPAGPPAGVKPLIDNVGVKLAVLVAVPTAVVTEIFPLAAAFGTVALIWVADSTT
jgi:hypothetical protein